MTTYKAVKVSGAWPSDLVAVFGVGGLGHLAVQYAKIAGATVVSVDIFEEKLDLARELGADHVVNAREQDPVEEIKKLGGADAAIDTPVSSGATEQAYGCLRHGGTLVLVGLPKDGYVSLPIFGTVLNSITVKGSIVGTREDLMEVFELHTAGRTRVVYEIRDLTSVNDAIVEVEKGKVDARLVFDLGAGKPAEKTEGLLAGVLTAER